MEQFSRSRIVAGSYIKSVRSSASGSRRRTGGSRRWLEWRRPSSAASRAWAGWFNSGPQLTTSSNCLDCWRHDESVRSTPQGNSSDAGASENPPHSPEEARNPRFRSKNPSTIWLRQQPAHPANSPVGLYLSSLVTAGKHAPTFGSDVARKLRKLGLRRTLASRSCAEPRRRSPHRPRIARHTHRRDLALRVIAQIVPIRHEQDGTPGVQYPDHRGHRIL
jgi:hypothetical protein